VVTFIHLEGLCNPLLGCPICDGNKLRVNSKKYGRDLNPKPAGCSQTYAV